MPLQAVIFDLDGVITDTAEYHFQAWKQLADEEGIPFSRADNEALRGVSRRESLLRILRGREVGEAQFQAMMDRKNSAYRALLAQIGERDLLPGVKALLAELDEADVPYAIASASRNARDVVERLGLGARLAAIADGNSVPRTKPAPDLFRFAAAQLELPPRACLVVEDADAGIAAALKAGMPALALGPRERFAGLSDGQGQFAHRESLDGVTLADLRAMVDPDPLWRVVEEQFDAARQHHMETVFTTGNGVFASRGAFEEGYPGDHALTLAHGVFDDAPIVMTELANMPNWLDVRLYCDGQRFRLGEGEILDYARQLDLRRGLLQRHVRWQAPDGLIVDLTFERFISYSDPHLAALRLLATPLNRDATILVETGIDGYVSNDDLLHWNHVAQGSWQAASDTAIWLHSRTRHSGTEIGAAALARHGDGAPLLARECPRHPSLQHEAEIARAQTLQVEKVVAYTTSRDLVENAGAVVERAVAQLQERDYDALKRAHLQAWQRVWHDIDVVIEGDDEAQLAIRFNLFQLQVAAPRNDDRVSIGAKTLSGLGYRGHVFWDTEIFILPFFTYTQPQIARNLLCYRYHTLEGARRKARGNGFRGAQYAWESALSGDEVTPRWVPSFDGTGLVRIWTGDIEIHITADVAYAILQYWRAACDDPFMRDHGAEIILDTARFWADRAEEEVVDGRRRYSFRDVIGPDEYHEHVDNNVYTNRMAQWHLETAREVWQWLQENAPQKAAELSAQLSLTPEELQRWEEVARHIVVHHDEESDLMLQFEGFFDLQEVDLSEYEGRTHSMQVLLGIEGANQSQVIKQADVIMLLCLLRDQYDEKTWRANWDMYMPRTDHQYGSSLGPSFHAWAACEMGRPNEAYEHFMLAARADLRDVRGNAGDGIHAASAGGVWQAVAFGFGGLKLHESGYEISPCLPSHWQRLSFKFQQCGQQHTVNIAQREGQVTKEVV